MTDSNTPSTLGTPVGGFILSDNLYNKAKWAVMILLPAIGALYFAIGEIWGLPKVTEVIGTISAVSTFLGVILGISTKTYNNSDARFAGEINIKNNDLGTKVFSLDLGTDPYDLEMLPEVTFKINSECSK